MLAGKLPWESEDSDDEVLSATLKNIATDHATWRRSEHRVHTVQNVQFVRSVAFCVAAPF